MTIQKGDRVKIEYTGKFEDGTVFDSSDKHGNPLDFEVGKGQVIMGFEKALVGMKKGDEKEFSLQPHEAYGDYNKDMIKDVPREQLPKEDLKPGMMLLMQLPDGNQLPAKIADVGKEVVSIDMNHPLAGKVLNFSIKVTDVTPVQEPAAEAKESDPPEAKPAPAQDSKSG